MYGNMTRMKGKTENRGLEFTKNRWKYYLESKLIGQQISNCYLLSNDKIALLVIWSIVLTSWASRETFSWVAWTAPLHTSRAKHSAPLLSRWDVLWRRTTGQREWIQTRRLERSVAREPGGIGNSFMRRHHRPENPLHPGKGVPGWTSTEVKSQGTLYIGMQPLVWHQTEHTPTDLPGHDASGLTPDRTHTRLLWLM